MVEQLSSDWELPRWRGETYRARGHRYVTLIPVLNEGERIRAQLQKMRLLAEVIDIVIVDGGSDDGALEQEFLQESNVRALLVKLGEGRLGSQLRVGLAWAMTEGYAGVVLIDGNAKDDPAAIPRFIERLDRGADHVQGSRYVPGGEHSNTPLSRHLGVRLVHAPLLSLAAGFRYTDTTNGFRAYSRRFLLDERVKPFRDVFTGYELHYYLAIRAARLGCQVEEIPVSRHYPSGKVPTKITGIRGNWKVLMALLKACFGLYPPRGRT